MIQKNKKKEWDRIMDRAKKANASPDRDRIKSIRQTPTDALSMLKSGAVTGAPDTGKEDLRILLTGRGARGPSFRAALKAMVSVPSASTHEDGGTHR